jgi:hypothetical protein
MMLWASESSPFASDALATIRVRSAPSPKARCPKCQGDHHVSLCPKGNDTADRARLTPGALRILDADAAAAPSGAAGSTSIAPPTTFAHAVKPPAPPAAVESRSVDHCRLGILQVLILVSYLQRIITELAARGIIVEVDFIQEQAYSNHKHAATLGFHILLSNLTRRGGRSRTRRMWLFLGQGNYKESNQRSIE